MYVFTVGGLGYDVTSIKEGSAVFKREKVDEGVRWIEG